MPVMHGYLRQNKQGMTNTSSNVLLQSRVTRPKFCVPPGDQPVSKDPTQMSSMGFLASNSKMNGSSWSYIIFMRFHTCPGYLQVGEDQI